MFGANVTFRMSTDNPKIRQSFDNPKTDAVLYSKAVRIRDVAIRIFQSQVKHTHSITLPPYVSSFRIDKVRGRFSNNYQVRNFDPAAFWVELGAYLHDSGHPMILRYKPLMRAVDVVDTEG